MNKGFCYQNNTKDPSAAKCGSKDFWKSIRLSSTPWMINTRREILRAVETQDVATMEKWLGHTDFRKFELKTLRDLKTKAGKDKWKKKSDEKKLLAWADDLKRTLPVFTFCCYEFDEVTRRKKNKKGEMVSVTERPRQLVGCHVNGLVMLDIDHVDNPLEVWEKLHEQEALMARVVLVHITSSGHGLRIIFTANVEDDNLADNIIVFAAALGYKADSSCIDATRNSFAPKEDEILFIDEERLFTYYDEEFDKRYSQLYREKKTQPLYHEFPAETSGERKEERDKRKDTKGSDPIVSLKWRGYDVQSIIDARYRAKLPCAADSNRHNESLKLASDLLVMFDGDRKKVYDTLVAQTWVQEIIDERNENVEQTVASAAERMAKQEAKYASLQPSTAMQDAIKEATGKTWKEIAEKCTWGDKETGRQGVQDNTINSQLELWGNEIEALSEEFPLLKDICKGLKRNQYPAAMFVGGGLLMTLMTRCTYRFYHRPEELRRLNNSTLIIGDPASGKSFATRLFKLIAAPIVAADKVGKDAINAYRELMKTKGANKEVRRCSCTC